MEKKKRIKLDKKDIFIILVIFILFFTIYYLASFDGVKKRDDLKIVTKIIDGDTIIVQGGEKIRLLGIDCDERGKKCYSNANKRIEELILNQKVFLEQDIEDKDIYGRSLRYIFLNQTNINLQLIKEGFCVARFEKGEKYKIEIVKAEEEAINQKIGCKWN